MSSDWNSDLSAARADLHEARDGESAELRLLAARRFRAIIGRFRDGGPPAIDALECAALATDQARVDAALRIYSALDDPQAVARFIDFYLRASGVRPHRPYIADSHLRRLGAERPVPFEVLDRVQSLEGLYLTFPRFRHPSEKARALFDPLLADADSYNYTLIQAMNGVARWPAPDLLRKVLALPPVQPPAGGVPSPIEGSPKALWPRDPRPHAAFLLALLGEADGLDALVRFASDRDDRIAGDAASRLAWLAHPAGIPPTAKLLRSRSSETVGAALDAVVDYGAVALAPAVIDLIERRVKAKNAVPDDAIGVLATQICDVTLPDEVSSFIGTPGHRVSEAGRRRALVLLRDAVAKLDPALRYRKARPLELAHLAGDLLGGPRTASAYQLRAITGEDHGGDPGDDVIANVPAIDAWRARAARPGPVPPGGWAFLGKPLPPPEVP